MTNPLVPLPARDADEASLAELVAEGRMLQTHLVFDLPRPRAVVPTGVAISIPDSASSLLEGMSSYGD